MIAEIMKKINNQRLIAHVPMSYFMLNTHKILLKLYDMPSWRILFKTNFGELFRIWEKNQ